jgi:hypothetical protein
MLICGIAYIDKVRVKEQKYVVQVQRPAKSDWCDY